MKRTRIKFCGITRAEDALLAAELGVDWLGFVFVPSSPRCLGLQAAARIRHQLPPGVQTVALVQDCPADFLAEVLAVVQPAIVQWHGNEPPPAPGFPQPWIKAVPMGEPQVWADWERRYGGAMALLADSHTRQGGGGSGHAFAWSQLPAFAQRRLPLMLAGGLQAETVGEAIAQVQPWAVDVSSGIERAKGIKDASKMRAFVEAVRAADAGLQG